ncbi:hypothetical protein N8I74_18340 [Chitiniphilus purpureus]|uniref:Type II/III secretion system secretin-like domain-containing protein n=1 Tax=Chitiniphilus purpureus TaxID=2981137 RepID=A0ABY6DLK5_9NEIS|nr:pilus (MSHA type) biogenesis protein MshL [Chitiniphilus sp. CD1]UXY15247.1 hypothetical protein N8I74_18340 [Chitiniphilus sp. CD1]
MVLGALLLAGCGTPASPEASAVRHIVAAPPGMTTAIPKPLQALPPLAQPTPAPPSARYTVLAERLPVNTLLFALARDAKVNLDVHPQLTGPVTLSAIDQTLPQILERISQQVALRWSLEQGVLSVIPDTAYPRIYRLDYLNLSRDMKSSATLANSVAGTGSARRQAGSQPGSGNASSARLDSISEHRFWQRLHANLQALADAVPTAAAPAANAASTPDTRHGTALGGNWVVIHPETGTITVRASERVQRRVADYLAAIQAGAQRQVMIEATIVEVTLSDAYQAGVDWSRLASGAAGLSFSTAFTGQNLAQPPLSVLSYTDIDGLLGGTFSLTVRLLEQFGRTRVLSSPRVMALNNQAALMKVVEEQVYFTLEINEDKNSEGDITNRSYASTLHTVPVGLVLQVIPQISAAGDILLNVRPTITNISGYVEDPAVSIVAAVDKLPVKSLVPVLQVREFDSTLRVGNGQTTVLGGLIQDSLDTRRSGLPGVSRWPGAGELFGYRDGKASKIELVVFLRPRLVHTADVAAGDLAAYRGLLPSSDFFATPSHGAAREDRP